MTVQRKNIRSRVAALPALLLPALLALGASPCWAAQYYVCDCASGAQADCIAGSDSNSGSSTADPWQSYGKARTTFNTMAAGDSIRFCRGGRFAVETANRWHNANCRAANPCTVSDYVAPWGNSSMPRPYFAQSGLGHGFALEDGGPANHEEGYVFENLKVVSSAGSAGVGSAFFIYNEVDDVIIRNIVASGFLIGVYAAGSNPCAADDAQCNGHNDRIVVRDSTIEDNTFMGWLGVSDDGQLLDNYFKGNGAVPIFGHNIYVADNGFSSSGFVIKGNSSYRSTPGLSSSCVGVSLVVHGSHDGLIIEDNQIWGDVGNSGEGCWGIAVDGGHAGFAEAFTNVTIRGNTIRNVGNLGIGIGACSNCVIENNVIIHENSFGFRGIAAPDRAAGPEDISLDQITIRNNSIYLSNDQGWSTGIHIGGSGTNHTVVSNAIHYAGTGLGWNCLFTDLPASSYTAIDYNACYYQGAPGHLRWDQNAGGQPTPLQAWQASSGFDLNSLDTDPGFTSPAGPLYDLSASSSSAAMVDNGHPTLSSVTAFGGVQRDSLPDIGAFEWTGP